MWFNFFLLILYHFEIHILYFIRIYVSILNCTCITFSCPVLYLRQGILTFDVLVLLEFGIEMQLLLYDHVPIK